MLTLHPNFVVPAMLKCTIVFYHFISLSFTLSLAGGHQVSRKQTSWLNFLSDQVIMMKYDVMKQFKLNILILLSFEI